MSRNRFLPLVRHKNKELEETEKGAKNIADATRQGLITKAATQRWEEPEALKSDIEIAILQTELQWSELSGRL